MIVVTGATSTIGSHVLRGLAEAGVACRGLVRDTAKAAAVLDTGTAIAVGDFDDRASIRAAVADADAVVLLTGTDPRQDIFQANVIDAVAATAGCPVLKISTVGADPASPAEFLATHGRSEAHLTASGLPATVLRPNLYMSNLFAAAASIAGGGPLAAPAGDARIAFIDARDVAACAVALLVQGADHGVHELSGPEALTYGEAAATLSHVLGRTVEFVDVDPPSMREGLLAAGLSAWFADGLLSLFGELRNGVAATPTATVEQLTGRAPNDLESYLSEHAAVFTPAAAPST